ncbi:hypothetical protein [Aquidulcibacter sp.]|uniref:hypothetical protein n=1 Tax=Aquidulcibacter sp. TaxID=2052990 RepID=UPI0025C53177|nr:hypothetical protein [Aquidulcibacter sp.]MCA3694798.1 hypothetical protein [Aquidulcibacter sp.]
MAARLAVSNNSTTRVQELSQLTLDRNGLVADELSSRELSGDAIRAFAETIRQRALRLG